MGQTKIKDTCVNTDAIVTITRDKMNFRVLNRYPKKDLKDTKDIERRLFEIFKKYEE